MNVTYRLFLRSRRTVWRNVPIYNVGDLLPSRGLGTYGRLDITHLGWQFGEAFLVDQACDVAMVFTATTSIAARITMTVIVVTGHG